jgi:tetratricopeptide (TPR) repeat protein
MVTLLLLSVNRLSSPRVLSKIREMSVLSLVFLVDASTILIPYTREQMGIFDKLRRKKEGASADARESSDVIKLVDKTGGLVLISKEDYRTRSLPAAVSANRSDPEQLSAIIITSLRDGFFSDVLEAAEHLYQIDPERSRGTCVYGIALMKNSRLEDAERVFLSHVEQYGEDGAVLTNLAKIYSERNETEKANATLWHALEVDPNTENALGWYAALAHERAGKVGQLEAWRRVAAIPGSWRAQLWLARIALESRDPKAALAYYRQSLSRVGDNVPADFLGQMTGDLGKHGLLAELIELSEPSFVPAVHGLQAGNNLIKANLDLGRIDRARSILNQLRMMQRPDWTGSLSFWAAEIGKHSS